MPADRPADRGRFNATLTGPAPILGGLSDPHTRSRAVESQPEEAILYPPAGAPAAASAQDQISLNIRNNKELQRNTIYLQEQTQQVRPQNMTLAYMLKQEEFQAWC
ncbi:hypothetical protein GQ53DRAFT_775473 [Thozetella sp. PMI_491]|nr:hypothetical protein GQ53DRAFT_775473 [Thozetella sp. PMI_491]